MKFESRGHLMRVAAVQMQVCPDKEQNLIVAAEYIRQLARKGVDLVMLPEMFVCPYQTDLFPLYAEPEGGECWQFLAALAAQCKIYLVGGSMPERDAQQRVYNTTYVFDRQGRMIAKHRKMHLFDVDIKNGQFFQESATLTAGHQATVFATEYGLAGLCICYDFRFPELSRLMVEQGAGLILVPGAFNMTTGPAHWEVLFRCRSIDNQAFTMGCAPARDAKATYQSWGHSLLVSPWGDVLNQLGALPGTFIHQIDLAAVSQIRQQLPLLEHRRKDLYSLYWLLDNGRKVGKIK